jgi:lipopolysaccharide export LptBFGC system permease protein LptF
MMSLGQRRKLQPVLLVAFAIGLLLVMLLVAAQQDSSHGGFVPLLFLLVPVFLYGLVGLCLSIVRDVSPDDSVPAAPQTRRALFQRPPPFLTA